MVIFFELTNSCSVWYFRFRKETYGIVYRKGKKRNRENSKGRPRRRAKRSEKAGNPGENRTLRPSPYKRIIRHDSMLNFPRGHSLPSKGHFDPFEVTPEFAQKTEILSLGRQDFFYPKLSAMTFPVAIENDFIKTRKDRATANQMSAPRVANPTAIAKRITQEPIMYPAT